MTVPVNPCGGSLVTGDPALPDRRPAGPTQLHRELRREPRSEPGTGPDDQEHDLDYG